MVRFELLASEFRDWIHPVLEFASRDDMLPVLTGVRLSCAGKPGGGATLTALATNRFVAAECSQPLAASPGGFDLLIPRPALAGALSLFQPRRRRTEDGRIIRCEVRPHADTPSLSLTGTTVQGFPASLTLEHMPGEFPAVGPVIEAACREQETPAAVVGVDPKWLLLIRHAVRDDRTAVLHMPPAPAAKAIGVTVGDHFRAAIMPRRKIEG